MKRIIGVSIRKPMLSGAIPSSDSSLDTTVWGRLLWLSHLGKHDRSPRDLQAGVENLLSDAEGGVVTCADPEESYGWSSSNHSLMGPQSILKTLPFDGSVSTISLKTKSVR